MPTSERRRQRGFTWLLLLFGLALGSAALARAAELWQARLQRDLERELIFRGSEIERAIAAFRTRTAPDGTRRCPKTWQELVEDRRGEPALHHLRRIYLDPFTGRDDWLLERQADGGFCGVRSRSRRVAYLRETLPPTVRVQAPAGRRATVGDWLFGEAAPEDAGRSDQSAVTEAR